MGNRFQFYYSILINSEMLGQAIEILCKMGLWGHNKKGVQTPR